LYLELEPRSVDVNVSPAKTEVHFLEPSRVRGFIIRTLRGVLSKTMIDSFAESLDNGKNETPFIPAPHQASFLMSFKENGSVVRERPTGFFDTQNTGQSEDFIQKTPVNSEVEDIMSDRPLGRVIGQYGK
jgi:DNA mismatch repair ATPase MutL